MSTSGPRGGAQHPGGKPAEAAKPGGAPAPAAPRGGNGQGHGSTEATSSRAAASSEPRGAETRGVEPTTIKKYANRRLYHTGTSTYVTLEDLARMVKAGEDFVVYDAKSGDDITRSVLTQIIFEQETAASAASGQSLLPVAFLKQLIRFYGDQMQALVPSYLDLSIESLNRERHSLRDQMGTSFGRAAAEAMESQVRANIAMMQGAMRVFAPFGIADARSGAEGGVEPPPAAPSTPERREPESAPAAEMEALKTRLAEMERRLERLAAPLQAESAESPRAASQPARPASSSRKAGPKSAP